jgi:hypothetical protein
MLNHMIGAMIAGGVFLIGAVVTIAPDSVQVTNSFVPAKKPDVVVAPLPFLTDDTDMRMRPIYRKPEEQQKLIAVPDRPMGNSTSLTVISPYLTPVALRAAIRSRWAFPDEEE